MDSLKKARTYAKASFIKRCNKALKIIDDGGSDLLVKQLYDEVLELWKATQLAHENYLKSIEDENLYMKELDWIDEPEKRLDDLQLKYYSKNENQHDVEPMKHDVKNHKFIVQTDISQETEVTSSSSRPNARLPKLEVPTFSGDPTTWTSFYDMFTNVIDHNTYLSDVEKFSYLRSLVKGEASRTIEGFPLTDANYPTAKSLLEERYGQTQTIINLHLNKLRNARPFSSSAKDLRRFHDFVSMHQRSLLVLGVPESDYERLLLISLMEKVSSDVRDRILQDLEDNEYPMRLQSFLGSLLKIIRRKEIGDTFESSAKSGNDVSDDGRQRSKHNFGFHALPVSTSNCVFCNRSHPSEKCRTFKQLRERRQILYNAKRCYKCLNFGHLASNCLSSCNSCHGPHHISICSISTSSNADSPASSNSLPSATNIPSVIPTSEIATSSNIHQPVVHSPSTTLTGTSEIQSNKMSPLSTEFHGFQFSTPSVLLQTANGCISNPDGYEKQKVRVLMDSGSSRSFILDNVAKTLNCPVIGKFSSRLNLLGGSVAPNKNRKIYRVEVRGINGNTIVNAVGLEVICGDLPFVANLRSYSHLSQLPLAEDSVERVSLLVGKDHYWNIFSGDVIKGQDSEPVAMDSIFGWVASGVCSESSSFSSSVSSNLALSSLDDTLERFFSLESVGIKSDELRHDDANSVLLKFNSEITYDSCEKRYEVSLPWKHPPTSLPSNFFIAKRRFQSLLHRLSRDKDLCKSYASTFDDYFNMGFIEEVPSSSTNQRYYLPHHPVVKEDSATTKTRIVFDGSCKIPSFYELSLNDHLDCGPDLIASLFSILIRFRLHKYAIISDIEKAFLQVSLKPSDRNFTCFLWLRNSSRLDMHHNIITYRFCRVPFGLTSSPFLLGATLQHHLSKFRCPVVNKMKDNFYVDNLVVGCSSVDECLSFYKESKEILNLASMNLRQWFCNDEYVVSQIPEKDRYIRQSPCIKILGMLWHPTTDILSISPVSYDFTDQPTKRIVFKYLAKVFDPLGIISPITLLGKLFMKKLWMQNLEWDEMLPANLLDEWNNLVPELQAISRIQIPRHLRNIEVEFNETNFQLHVFTDASTAASACCIYIRISCSDHIRTYLLASKTKVAPKHDLTIPRKELVALVMGKRLLDNMCISLKIQSNFEKHIWSDSEIALSWIFSKRKLETFVHNRVLQLRSNDVQYHHVASEQNPADISSRGCRTDDLISNPLWFEGPTWLSSPPSAWPIADKPDEIDDSSDINLLVDDLAIQTPFEIDANRFSSSLLKPALVKLLRVTALCKRFCSNLRLKRHNVSLITADEITVAKYDWEYFIQHRYFGDVFDALSSGNKHQIVNQLGVRVSDGLLRCHGRYANSRWTPDDMTFPKLLPRHDVYTKLVIQYFHERLYHAGVNHTLNSLRREYWILKGRSEVKRILSRCLTCNQVEGGSFTIPLMPPLPKSRVEPHHPFTFVGLDYLGPFHVRFKKTDPLAKVWIVLFTCLTVRAIHLEITQDMTADEFILCLRRFIARYGTPHQILSDNAKQFKLTSNVCDRLWQELIQHDDVQNYVSNQGIRWKFIMELAPWQGGIYERLVGLVKRCICKTVRHVKLTLVQFQTTILEICSILNTRPLTYVDEQSTVITPMHFIRMGSPENQMGPPLVDSNVDAEYIIGHSNKKFLLNNWKKGINLLDRFWNSWLKDYLSALNERLVAVPNQPKCARKLFSNIGDTVIINEKNIPRANWKLARIVEFISDSNDIVRGAKLLLPSGIIVSRAIQLLHPMELDSPDDKLDQTDLDETLPYGKTN